MEYRFESGDMWNIAVGGGVWNMVLRVVVCGIWF